jgi:hypothetical protein
MPWIFLLLALAAFALALLTPSMALMVLGLLASLGLLLAWALSLYAQRVGARRGDGAPTRGPGPP